MQFWCRRISILVGCFGFLFVFFCGIRLDELLNISLLIKALLKGILGGVLLWFAGFIISDIVLKGILEDIPEENLNQMEGGIVQRFYERKRKPRVINKTEKDAMKRKRKPEKHAPVQQGVQK